jgi:hypothetical protein
VRLSRNFDNDVENSQIGIKNYAVNSAETEVKRPCQTSY